MGDWRVLRDFIVWGANNYPSDHLAVVAWDHGSGWQPTRAAKPRSRAFSQDEQTGNEILAQETVQALSNLPRPLDLLIFDASLMQMIENAYEFRNLARILVGSEESPPGEGYPYDRWLTDLKLSGRNPCEVAGSIMNRFVDAYPNNTNITQSVIDLSRMQTLANALNNFANNLRARVGVEADLIRRARIQSQNYSYPDNKDLYHYADLIRTGTSSSQLQQAAAALQSALTGSNGAIIASRRGAFGQNGSHGLAVYIPDAINYLPSYGDLALSRTTNWDEFLQQQQR